MIAKVIRSTPSLQPSIAEASRSPAMVELFPDLQGAHQGDHRPEMVVELHGGVRGPASMAESQTDLLETGPIELTPTQQQVIEILGSVKSTKYPLGDWYLGAIYAVKNTYNPDRYAQAAQSLRELLEKLPRVFGETEIQESRPGFRGMRDSLYSRLSSDKKRYDGAWKGKKIDTGLDKTIRNVDRYLELNQIPARKDQIHAVMNQLDPMYETLDQGIKSEKSERFHNLWNTFEGFAHHKIKIDDVFFGQQLSLAERLIIGLLAPITAQDQGAIQAILLKPNPDQDDFDKLFELIKRRGANYAFFFKNVDNPAWIAPLAQNGFFNLPPNVEATGDGQILAPIWWPIFYLQKVSVRSAEQVVDIILGLKPTDNPRILHEIFSIGCDLPDLGLSLRLKPLIKKFLQSPYRWGEDELIVNILQKWGGESGKPLAAAQEIVQYVIAFQPDPKEEEKRSRRKENPEARNTALEPVPRFDPWEYQQIIEKGVRPLAEREPFHVARILIAATANMIRMGTHTEDLDTSRGEDYSEIWCRRLDKLNPDYQNVKDTLVHTMAFACGQVYDKDPQSIEVLDRVLRSQRWKVFRRLRQLLYATHPNDQTFPWIRELILGHDDYSKWEHHYEFQLMVRKVSEHFGLRLLSEGERTAIFDAILSGPSKEDFREWMGERYSEEAFQQRQRHFHRMQLRPFAALLTGEYQRSFNELEGEAQAESISDDSYSPYGEMSGGVVTYRSPKSSEDLEILKDDELLAYLNEWNEGSREKDNWLVEINISALSGVFQSLFSERIAPDAARLAFWMAHRDKIARPIYVSVMVKSMQEFVKDKNVEKLDQWIEFCAWILLHPDPERVEGLPKPRDESRDHPDWGSSRRAVVDFIDACVNKDTGVPATARDGLANLLQHVCIQFDWRLDRDRPVLLNRDDQITEAINNTRSRALESLVNFGFWIRRQNSEDTVPEVTDILSKRMSKDAELPLTRPEHALLGMHFGNLCVLNRDWAIEQRKVMFPKINEPIWRDAFESYIRYNPPVKRTFEVMREDYEYALDHLNVLTATKNDGKDLVDKLGQHLFTYYLWKVHPLTGDESLLARYYDKTSDDRQRWAQLFDHVGRTLRNSSKNLDKELVDRVIAYFDWRLDGAERLELQKFTYWLEAECLDPEWRLRSYSKILDFGREKNAGLSMELRTLNKLLPYSPPLAVECFAKIIEAMARDTHMYVSADEAKCILKAGLKAEDPQARENAERARENLLRCGRFNFLDME
ncbi:MAG TPA: hypothetical protein VGK27_05025 [Candidatus Deferrimicrobiaceae bacterium]